jgi:hypothetical protein
MFDFTEEDLRLNKCGQLSPRQREWLKGVAHGARSFSWTGALIITGFTFLGLCITLGLYLQNEDSRAGLLANPWNLLVFPVTILVVGGVIISSIALAYWNAKKLENATLLSVTGSIRLNEDASSKGGTTYYIFVGKKRFAFGEDMSHMFKEGSKYKVYYCKPGMYEFVLSLEPVNT